MRGAVSRGLAAFLALAGVATVAAIACSNDPPRTVQPYKYEGPVPWDGGCPDDNTDCPGLRAFACAMEAIEINNGRCRSRGDCTAALGPEPADCFNMCGHAPVSKVNEGAYLQQAKTEVFKYCNQARCNAELNCPRPEQAMVDCVDAGNGEGVCGWVRGDWTRPDAGLDASGP